ncbi:hypothetical protein EOD42_22515 [Rhodovarius crocodyli]|uniref:Uncharacterized protein n=1 Tax=Rhodovarius crocodyli TaxID=1979269 RepID=A0A437M1F5_9PROT|nr:hypothetical protein [Rhodovarius crocodyli]RVT91432.1 hypothetical protein EOD42_22515 [Rhodovarius crocodyli]
MKCRHCAANLGQISATGEPLIRSRGILLKAEGVSMICPKCKGDVPVEGELAKALSARLLLVFKGNAPRARAASPAEGSAHE